MLVFQVADAAVVDFGDAGKGADVLAVLLGESLEGFDVAGGELQVHGEGSNAAVEGRRGSSERL